MLIKVGLQYKSIYRRQGPEEEVEPKEIVRGINVELDSTNFNSNFQKFLLIYTRKTIGFKSRRRRRFWSHPDLVKSDRAKGILTKAFKRQKFFLEVVIQDYSSAILFLDTIPEGSSLLSLRKIILDIKSLKFPNILFFHSVDRI